MNRLELEKTAIEIRKGIVTAVHSAGAGHPGGSLSAAELLTYLYFEEMDIDPEDPKKDGRDRFVLSKGHSAPGLYATLAQRGYFPAEDLKSLRHLGSYLQGHPDMKHIPGVDMSSGSLGQGISAAAGMALSAKLSGASWRVYTLLGDGEIQEGQVWEAAMFAGARKLDNLVVVIDNNGLQIDGKIEDVCSPYPIDKKFEAFNFHVINVADGNDFGQLKDAFDEARETKGMPTAIVMRTIKGKGISYMENQAGWHGKAPNDEEYAVAMAELEKAGDVISVAVIAYLWKFIYDPNFGLLNNILHLFGHQGTVNFFSTENAIWSVLVVLIWHGFGWGMLIYYTGIKNIDPVLYEAASIDGASTSQTFLRITLPMMKPVIQINVTMAVISALKQMETVYLLTNGGPGNSTQFAANYLYQQAFKLTESYRYDLGVAHTVCRILIAAGIVFDDGLFRFDSGRVRRSGCYGWLWNLQDIICDYHAAFKIFDSDSINYDFFK